MVELSARAQASLLRVLQEQELERLGDNTVRKIDVRVVAATNEDLATAVKEGRFRSDLFYRLSAYPVRIPSLRERREDIPLFLDFFLKKYSREHGKSVSGISDKSLDLLLAYDWPGNIRELENVIERAIILTEPNTSINLDMVLSPTIADTTADAHELDRDGQLVKTADRAVLSGLADIAEHLIEQEISIDDIETAVLARAMEKAGGKVSKAARLVGMTRPAFAYRLKKNQASKPNKD